MIAISTDNESKKKMVTMNSKTVVTEKNAWRKLLAIAPVVNRHKKFSQRVYLLLLPIKSDPFPGCPTISPVSTRSFL